MNRWNSSKKDWLPKIRNKRADYIAIAATNWNAFSKKRCRQGQRYTERSLTIQQRI